jgi:hypothetical protein
MPCPCGGCIVGLSRTLRVLRRALSDAERFALPDPKRCDELSSQVAQAQDDVGEAIKLREVDPQLRKHAVVDAIHGVIWAPPKPKRSAAR